MIYAAKIGINVIVSAIIVYLSFGAASGILVYKEMFALVAFLCSSAHLIVYRSATWIDFVLQAISLVIFLILYMAVRFAVIGL